MFELESHSKHPLILSASCKKLETWQLPVSRADVNIYIMYMRGTSHVSGSPVLLFFCWWYSLLESHWICGSNEFSNYCYVSVDIRKKRKVWFKYRDMYCSCTNPERFVRGGPTLTKVFLVDERIKIPQSAGHHRPASETPFNAVSLAGR